MPQSSPEAEADLAGVDDEFIRLAADPEAGALLLLMALQLIHRREQRPDPSVTKTLVPPATSHPGLETEASLQNTVPVIGIASIASSPSCVQRFKVNVGGQPDAGLSSGSTRWRSSHPSRP